MGTRESDALAAAAGLARGFLRPDNVTPDGVVAIAAYLTDANDAAERCNIREGETIAELIKRLYDETLDDD